VEINLRECVSEDFAVTTHQAHIASIIHAARKQYVSPSKLGYSQIVDLHIVPHNLTGY
jgi:hypothetical protein